MVPGTFFGEATPGKITAPNGAAVQVGDLTAAVRYNDLWVAPKWDGPRFSATSEVEPGDRAVIALVAVYAGPLIVPDIAEVDERIDLSDRAWREWAGSHPPHGDRSGSSRTKSSRRKAN